MSAVMAKPNRVLTPDAQAERDDFDQEHERRGCTCCISPPCSHCLHPGNPRNQEEDPDAWMDELLDLDELEREARAAVASTVEAAAARHLQEMARASAVYRRTTLGIVPRRALQACAHHAKENAHG